MINSGTTQRYLYPILFENGRYQGQDEYFLQEFFVTFISILSIHLIIKVKDILTLKSRGGGSVAPPGFLVITGKIEKLFWWLFVTFLVSV